MKIVVTGGAGFIGSHVAEYFAVHPDCEVIVVDNLSRGLLVRRSIPAVRYNWNYLKAFPNIRLIEASVTDTGRMTELFSGANAVIHTAGQTAVTTSVTHPAPDFENNARASFSVLEAARCQTNPPTVIFCSTNKVYGENVNAVSISEGETRYAFSDAAYKNGVPESMSIDGCKHTPYGCSKLAADIYMQDYARMYGMKIGVFRMSCIYGTRQLGLEDQGWLMWFTIATILGKPITVYGDGKQVRDVLFVDDLVRLFDAFLQGSIMHGVYNAGGGPAFTISLLELLEKLKPFAARASRVSFSDWRPSDQKVYVSDIRKAARDFGWAPKISVDEGLPQLVRWVQSNRTIFEDTLETVSL